MLWLDDRCVRMRVCKKVVTQNCYTVHALIMQARFEKRFWADEYPTRVKFFLDWWNLENLCKCAVFEWIASQEEQGWHTGEGTCPPPMWPRFKSRHGYLMCGLSLLLVVSLVLRGFSVGTPVFPSQRAKKVVSDSMGLVDFAVGLVNCVLNLPDG